ncbi:MAG: hypothetical protein LBC99_02705 [Spirochaetota bacterium]|nr:hypothetical protein [Spirochaetota bacterium]
MKKTIFSVILILPCVFALISCGDDVPAHTDPSFLVGAWASSNATFTITDDLSFECVLINVNVLDPTDTVGAKIGGKLDINGLGTNQYKLTDLHTISGDPAHEAGNTGAGPTLLTLNGIKCSLTPDAARTKFVFASSVTVAQKFFGDTYIKQL